MPKRAQREAIIYNLRFIVTIAGLASHLKRDYKNVHNDIDRLAEWHAVEKDAQGLVFAPYDEIVVNVRMPAGRAA